MRQGSIWLPDADLFWIIPWDINSTLAEFKGFIETKYDVISNRLNSIVENFQKHANNINCKKLNEN